MKMLCLVESDHGVNVMGIDRDYIINWLSDGVEKGHVKLGGTYLPDLKKSSLILEQQANNEIEQEASSAN